MSGKCEEFAFPDREGKVLKDLRHFLFSGRGFGRALRGCGGSIGGRRIRSGGARSIRCRVGEANVRKTDAFQFGIRDRAILSGLFGRAAFDLHQALGGSRDREDLRDESGHVDDRILQLRDELGHGHERAVGHGAREDPVTAVADAEDIHAVHGEHIADIRKYREGVPSHSGLLMGVEFSGGPGESILFGAECFDDHQALDPLLHEDPELPVLFLHVLMHSLKLFAHQEGEKSEDDGGGEHDECDPRIEEQKHSEGAGHLDEHAEERRQDLHDAVGDQDRVIGQAVQPFARVRGGYPREIPVEDLPQKVGLKLVFEDRFRVFREATVDGRYNDTKYFEEHEEKDIAEECVLIGDDGAVDDGLQKQRIKNADRAHHDLNEAQQQDERAAPAGYFIDPS